MSGQEQRHGAARASVAGMVLLAVATSVVTGWVDWVSVGQWARPRAVLLGLWLLGGVLLAGGGYSWWSTRRPRPAVQGRRPPPLSWWAVAAAGLVIATVAWSATAWLLGQAATAADAGAARVEAIKVGLGIGAAATGVFALLLAVRRQWHQEITAADIRFDATERRVTELYTKAVEQLGSMQAPVRLGGLYALERLGQDNLSQQQTIVNVFCAYLRMPYTLPGDPPDATDADTAADTAVILTKYQERVQEREVRLTAQRLLATHLRPGTGPRTATNFWANINLDLTDATLIHLHLNNCRIRIASFNNAQFTGPAYFDNAQFTDSASFDKAQFTGPAYFGNAQFTGDAPSEVASYLCPATVAEQGDDEPEAG